MSNRSARVKAREVSNDRRLFAVLLAAVMVISLFAWNQSTVHQANAAPAAPNCNIVYDLGGGRTYTINSAMAMSMMTTNADGSYAIDPKTGYYYCDAAKMAGFFSGLEHLYPGAHAANTAGFQTTAGNYLAGYNASAFQQTNYIDTAKEIPYLAAAIMAGKNEVHVPSYRCSGTYVEVDKTNQTLYYYENGVLTYTTPIVSGNESRGNSTPSGIYSIRSKATNTYLTGANYSSFVHYWMAFIGNNYGIHDASWRSSFGGQIYLTGGSHGCVNVPPANMPALYAKVKVGTPVVIY